MTTIANFISMNSADAAEVSSDSWLQITRGVFDDTIHYSHCAYPLSCIVFDMSV